MYEFIMPKWGEMTEGTIAQWLKAEGDHISEGDPLVEITTEKINTEVESPVSGLITKILVSEGQTVEVGTVLAIIE